MIGIILLLVSAAQSAPSLDAAPVPHWQRALPGGKLNVASHAEHARPFFYKGSIFVGSAAGTALYKLSRSNGSLLHSYPASASVESEPVIIDDVIYFADTAGVTWAYSLSGELIWSYETHAPINAHPTISGEFVIVCNVDDLVIALNRSTGEMQWRYAHKADLSRESELSLFSAPPAVVTGENALVGFSDGALIALKIDTGEVEWSRRIGEGRYPDLLAAPLVVGDAVYTSGYFKPFVAVDLKTQTVRWRFDAGAAQAPTVAADEDSGEMTLYHPGTDGELRAFSTVTGEEMWSWDSDTAGSLSTPVVTKAGLFTSSSEGGVYLVDIKTGTEIWRYHEELNLIGVTSAPAVDDRQLVFVTNAGNIVSMVTPVGQ